MTDRELSNPLTDHSLALVIAIDGPSGSGKSSVSKRLATDLEADHLDTGAMYRAATLWCLNQGLKLSDPASFTTEQVLEQVAAMPLEITKDPQQPQRVLLDGADVTEAIRTPELSAQVSAVSTIPAAREILIDKQRQMIAASHRIVVEGRDITTVVVPDAHGRILLTASEETRMARRGLQAPETKNLRAEIVERDARDSSVVEFQKPAEHVALVDSTHLTFDQTVNAVLEAVTQQLAERTS